MRRREARSEALHYLILVLGPCGLAVLLYTVFTYCYTKLKKQKRSFVVSFSIFSMRIKTLNNTVKKNKMLTIKTRSMFTFFLFFLFSFVCMRSVSSRFEVNDDRSGRLTKEKTFARRKLLRSSKKFELEEKKTDNERMRGNSAYSNAFKNDDNRNNAHSSNANKFVVDDALARMYTNANKNARKRSPGAQYPQAKNRDYVDEAKKLQAEEVAKGDKTAVAFRNMENEIEEEAREAVAEATGGDVALIGKSLIASEIDVTDAEKRRWSFMDSRELRQELMIMTKERNKLAQSLGKLAQNCSQEMQMLFYKVENLEDTQKFYEKEHEQLTGKNERCKNDHDLLKEHAAKKVVKHMEYLGVDTHFIKPHRMDVKELLEAAELADKHKEDELFKRRMDLEEREGKQHTLEDLAKLGKKHDKEYKQRMKARVEGYQFKTIHRDDD